jgi:hypothetical protein
VAQTPDTPAAQAALELGDALLKRHLRRPAEQAAQAFPQRADVRLGLGQLARLRAGVHRRFDQARNGQCDVVRHNPLDLLSAGQDDLVAAE